MRIARRSLAAAGASVALAVTFGIFGVTPARADTVLTVVAADEVGITLLVVNALNDEAAGFYRRFGLEPSPTNPLDLMITVNDLWASLPPHR